MPTGQRQYSPADVVQAVSENIQRRDCIATVTDNVLAGNFNEWLLCDGRDVKRDDYPELGTILGQTYGLSSPTTFVLPYSPGANYINASPRNYPVGQITTFYPDKGPLPRLFYTVGT